MFNEYSGSDDDNKRCTHTHTAESTWLTVSACRGSKAQPNWKSPLSYLTFLKLMSRSLPEFQLYLYAS
jgi:hypothetical protein